LQEKVFMLRLLHILFEIVFRYIDVKYFRICHIWKYIFISYDRIILSFLWKLRANQL